MFQSCRRGDLEQVMYLAEQKEVELNIRDRWDSTPLYYACLCGHLDLVKYLLNRGAVCDASTFDGERCVYGALTNEIRKLLLEHKMLTPATMRREAYTEFLRSLFVNDHFKDVTFHIQGESVSAHKCILSARSAFLKQQFEERWRGRRHVNLSHRLISFPAFTNLLEWLYTGQVKLEVKNLAEFSKLAKYCKLTLLQEELEKAFNKANEFVQTKRGVEITVIHLDSTLSLSEVQADMGVLATQAIPLEFRPWEGGAELPGLPSVEQQFVDLVFSVGEYKFFCHRPVFLARSEFFQVLLEDHFNEATEDEEANLTTINLNQVSPEVFSCIVFFVYTNDCEISEDLISELLHTADMCLLPGLKKLCGKWLAKVIDRDNVLEILRTSRLFHLARLEDLATEFLAQNIEQMWEDPDLRSLVESDAREVLKREETDSIAIIDDIRSHITSKVKNLSDIEDAECRMLVVDQLLEELELAA